MTDLIERIQALDAKDGDVLVLTAQRKLTLAERDALNIQMITLSGLFLGRGKDVSTIVLDNGLDLKLVRTSELKAAVPALELEEAAAQFAKTWEHESSSAQGAAHDSFIAGANFTPVYSAEVKTGLRMGDDLLHAFYEGGKCIRRASWPEGDYLHTDGAYGSFGTEDEDKGTIWYFDVSEDEGKPHYRLGFHDLGAGDWEILG